MATMYDENTRGGTIKECDKDESTGQIINENNIKDQCYNVSFLPNKNALIVSSYFV